MAISLRIRSNLTPEIGRRAFNNATRSEFRALGTKIQRWIQQKAPKDTGQFKGSIKFSVTGLSTGGNELFVFSDDVSGKAYAIEKGRKPGKGVPAKALIPFVRRKGLARGAKNRARAELGIAIRISMNIKAHGLPSGSGRKSHGLGLFKRALVENRQQINNAIGSIERQAVQALNR